MSELDLKPETESKQRERIQLTYQKAVRIANMERSGFEWLLDQNLDTDNVMFLDCFKEPKFTFGWRGGYDSTVVQELKCRLVSFPYPYEIKSCQ